MSWAFAFPPFTIALADAYKDALTETESANTDEVLRAAAQAHRVEALAETRGDGGALIDEGAVPVLARSRKGPGMVVTTISGKAGIGKSLVTANLAAAAAQNQGLTTAVVDLSLQFGDQGLMFDTPASPSMVDVLVNVDALTPDFLLECMHRGPADIRVLTAPPSPELADLVEPAHIRPMLSILRSMFDVIFVDTESHLSDVTIEAIETADRIVLVCSPYLASVKDTKLLLKTLNNLQVPGRKLTAVLNRVEPGIRLTMELVEINLKFPVGLELPHSPAELVESVTEGVPVVIAKSTLAWSQRVAALAADVTAQAGAEPRKPKRSFLGLNRS